MLVRFCATFAVFAVLVPVAVLSGCGEPRVEGICYCHFFSGDESEYDLRDLDRDAQQAQCIQHDADAEAFAGDCELE